MTTQSVQYKGNDKLLFGIILGVLAFWLFAQTTLNINVDMAKDLGIESSLMNIAVSITSLFSGIFIVVFGGLADKIGRVKMVKYGFCFSIIGSLLVGLTPVGGGAGAVLILGRIFQGLSGAAIMPASLALVKAYWEGKERQRAISLWSMGSWGGSGFAALFGGLMVGVGWRYIFYAAAAISLIGLLMIWNTPESKAEVSDNKKTDFAGIITFMLSMIGLQLLVSKGSEFGWTSPLGITLIVVTVIFAILFFKIEKGKEGAFIDFKLFNNLTFTGATISNFMINGTAGMLIVSLALLQVGGDLTAKAAGMLTLGYAISIVLFIRVGEKLLQRFGARKPMIWGSLIVGVSIILLMFTNVMTDTYKILCIISYTLFGLGLAFYATPSTDAALSNLPEAQAGSGSGIYKMASSLGAAFGVAISAGVFSALRVGDNITWMEGVLTFVGRQDNVAVRQAATIALGINLLMVILAIISIMITIPKQPKKMK
ncbi:MAG TPA: MFS transporter [Bacteroidales bacterium]|nr:MFS transporter [Bacteroidales bacterium]HPZ03363.1 MFS transporter [Bacteroidales bacterium]HQB75715.1 MFS transporter [Bacteroidales bacterium]